MIIYEFLRQSIVGKYSWHLDSSNQEFFHKRYFSVLYFKILSLLFYFLSVLYTIYNWLILCSFIKQQKMLTRSCSLYNISIVTLNLYFSLKFNFKIQKLAVIFFSFNSHFKFLYWTYKKFNKYKKAMKNFFIKISTENI